MEASVERAVALPRFTTPPTIMDIPDCRLDLTKNSWLSELKNLLSEWVSNQDKD